MKKINFGLFKIMVLAVLIAFTSCRKTDKDNDNQNLIINDINELVVPNDFNFETGTEVEFKVYVKTNQDVPLNKVRLDILTDFRENGGKQLSSGVTDESGLFLSVHPLPAYYEKVVIATNYIGLPSETEVFINNGKIDATIGGSQPPDFKSSAVAFKTTNSVFQPLGPYNSQGVPLYLEPENDVIDPGFLNDINASFPESQPVPTHNPHYLDPENEYDFKLQEPSEVWVTFIHEGAGYKNVFGYYTYIIGNPPASSGDIDTINIVFPNVSFQGSGGGLVSGNKVYLGVFPQNTAIGWVLIADGFSNGQITNGRGVYFSNPDLNPETTPEKRQHAVHLLDNGRDLFILGFEDLNRDGHSDDDFNDAMFFITANPITAVDLTGFQTVTYTSDDADGDGIPNQFDDYPDDPERAFNNFYPSEEGFGTLAFEDLWPAKGDYDFNDMVIDYNINQITNGNNQVVEILASFTLRAMGASFKNGFGFQLPFQPGDIATVTGQNLTESIISLNANNTEAGQTNAVIIAFDNGFKVLPYPGGGIGVNTDPSAPYVDPVTIEIAIVLTEPKPLNQVGIPPYNPFIFTNQRRGYEIHLPDRAPTDLADPTILGTSHDNSIPADGRFYKTQNNLPWALHIMDAFDYPIEKSQIIHGYNYMTPWAQTSGQNHSDWFKDFSGYRNNEHIYTR
jgi:LruC domain-containing protein